MTVDDFDTLCAVDPSPVQEPAAEQPSIVVPAPRSEPGDSIVPAVTPLVPSTPPAAVVRRTGSGSPWPMRLAIIFGVLSFLCVGGLGVAYHIYDKATKPDRSTPAVAVQNYLLAFMVDRSDVDARQYACSDQSGLADLRTFRDQAKQFAADRGDTVSFSWTIGDVDTAGAHQAAVSVVITQLTTSANGQVGQSLHSWTFATLQVSGWRVCGATRIS